MSSDPRPDAATFLMQLARSLHAYGTPAHRLENALDELSKRLGVEAQFLVTPTSITASINSQAFLERVEPGDVDLGRLTDLRTLIADLTHKRIGVREARDRLFEIRDRPAAHGRLATIASFGLASAAAGAFFDGGPAEVLAAGLVGLVVGLLVAASSRLLPRLAPVLPAVAGGLAAIVAGLLGLAVDPLFSFIPTLAGLIILIPGLTLTIAVNELAYGHLVSGTARLTGALMSFLQIAFGVALGNKLITLFVDAPAATPPEPLPGWVLIVAVCVTAVALTVLFRARPKDLPILLVAVGVAFAGSRLGTRFLGPELGVLLGAWLVGTVGYVLSRWRGLPSAVAILPGILPLVPGSVGFRSLSSLLAHDVVSGIQTAFTTILMAVSLVAGLLLASLARRPEEAL